MRGVEDVDLDDLADLLGIALMVRDRVMRIAEADFGIGAAAHLMADLEGADARHVGLPGEHLQIRHQPVVVGER